MKKTGYSEFNTFPSLVQIKRMPHLLSMADNSFFIKKTDKQVYNYKI